MRIQAPPWSWSRLPWAEFSSESLQPLWKPLKSVFMARSPPASYLLFPHYSTLHFTPPGPHITTTTEAACRGPSHEGLCSVFSFSQRERDEVLAAGKKDVVSHRRKDPARRDQAEGWRANTRVISVSRLNKILDELHVAGFSLSAAPVLWNRLTVASYRTLIPDV